MRSSARRNFHVPLPEDVYRLLRDEAASMKRPATVLARHAIEVWLRALREAIAAYAAAHAGSEADLDPALEGASLELWRTPKRGRR